LKVVTANFDEEGFVSKARTYCEIRLQSARRGNGNVGRKPVKRSVAHAGLDLHDNRDFMILIKKGREMQRSGTWQRKLLPLLITTFPLVCLIGSESRS
jgi:hypothetical protein